MAAEHQRLDRQTFIGSTYNWARKGLTWEEAARDLYNYILQARGEKPVAKTARLIPPRIWNFTAAKVTISDKAMKLFTGVEYHLNLSKEIETAWARAFPPYHTPPKPPENGCPDKLEPVPFRCSIPTCSICNHKL